MASCCELSSCKGKRTIICWKGVLGGEGAGRRPRLRLDRAAKVDELDVVLCRSWPDAFVSWAWLAEGCNCWPVGSVMTELLELVDDLLNCLEASDTVGDGCESTGEGAVPYMLSVGETARILVGDVWEMSAGLGFEGTVVRGASGTGFAVPKPAPYPSELARKRG